MEELLNLDPNLKTNSPKSVLFFNNIVAKTDKLTIFNIARKNIPENVLFQFVKKSNNNIFEPLLYSKSKYELFERINNIKLELLLLRDSVNDKDIDNYKNLSFDLNKLINAFNKYPVKNYSFIDVPKIKTEENKLLDPIIKENCYDLLQQSWFFEGPIVASLCFAACFNKEASFKALKRVWFDILSTIEEYKNEDPIFIYNSMSKESDRLYCSASYNFLLEFYEKGLCNCTCGSYLFFLISKIRPIENKKVFLFIEQGHMYPAFDTETKFETTITPGQKLKITNKIYYGLYSEQMVGIFILFYTLKTSYKTIDNCFLLKEVLSIDIQNEVVYSLINADRSAIKNYLDSNTFDIVITMLILICKNIKCDRFYGTLVKLNSEYFKKDVEDILNNVVYTKKELQDRMIEFTNKIQHKLNIFMQKE